MELGRVVVVTMVSGGCEDDNSGVGVGVRLGTGCSSEARRWGWDVSCDDDSGGIVVGWLGVGGYDDDSGGMVVSSRLGWVSGSCNIHNNGVAVGLSRAAYCKAHGGGRRCHHLGCMKSADGQTEHCIAHGGGRHCSYPTGCSKAARGKSGLCIKHGGGKRCVVEGCTRSAERQVGLCISHGGGRRCRFDGCDKGAQGSTTYCKAHGGGKRCVFVGCSKGAEGSTPLCKAHGGGRRCLYEGGGICPKSVHGGTNFCVAHGGGKRCDVAGCTKSARGRTNCCVKHGGGKRCKFDKCTKSAQGSTDFCKAHGGGKRCIWGGEGKCKKFARGRGGLCAAHGNMVQESEGNKKGVLGIGSQLFHGVVLGPVSASLDNYSLSGASVVSNSGNWLQNPVRNRQLIPPQVLVPFSMKSSTFSSVTGERSSDQKEGSNGGLKGSEVVVPEGRVHNGGLLLLMGGNLRDAVIDGI
ncbi:probable WRKY transcription factor 19 [Cynara cardunculus var. scolymus]|nr:probable WRKY transcription factor 19 [Cynara cardunculus var. scolymus]